MATIGISAEARGRLRVLVALLENDARRIEAATDKLPGRLLRDFERKGHVGAHRALMRVLAGVPIRPFYSEGRSLAFRYLAPAPVIPAAAGMPVDQADQQPAVLVKIVMLNAGGGRPRMTREPFGIGYTTHALGRLLDRSTFSADPVAAMFEAHDALLVLPPVEGARIFDRAELPVPAAGGAFLTSPRRIGAAEAPLAVARTWINRDLLRDEQDAHLATWRTLVDQVKHG
jgi:hypothetical protein